MRWRVKGRKKERGEIGEKKDKEGKKEKYKGKPGIREGGERFPSNEVHTNKKNNKKNIINFHQ